jgi:hypothetical protein
MLGVRLSAMPSAIWNGGLAIEKHCGHAGLAPALVLLKNHLTPQLFYFIIHSTLERR